MRRWLPDTRRRHTPGARNPYSATARWHCYDVEAAKAAHDEDSFVLHPATALCGHPRRHFQLSHSSVNAPTRGPLGGQIDVCKRCAAVAAADAYSTAFARMAAGDPLSNEDREALADQLDVHGAYPVPPHLDPTR